MQKKHLTQMVCGLLVMTMLQKTYATLQGLSYETTDGSAAEEVRDPRLFFTLVTVRADSCTTKSTANPTGICYTSRDCTNLGGTGSGTCAGGIGVCCYFALTCGQSTKSNGSSFINPSSPSTDSTVSNCELTVALVSNNICQLRLDFNNFELEQPNLSGQCETDFMTVTGTANDASIPTLCGSNTGKHMYVDLNPAGGSPVINIDTGLTAFARSWDISITQVACNSAYKAPEGCVQYYTNSSGVVESFNYAIPTDAAIMAQTANLHLNNLHYGVCVSSRTGYCSITWAPNNTTGTNPYSFMMTGDATAAGTTAGTPDASLTGTTDCITDYVLIPGGSYTNSSGATVNGDRFCGLGFQTQVISAIQPFVMYVVTDATDDPAAGEVSNVGFSLQYRQNAC